MRIAVVDLLPEGGAKRVVFEQLKGLGKKHTLLYCTSSDDCAFDFDQIRGITVRQYDVTSAMKGWMPYDIKLFTRLLPIYGKIAQAVDNFRAEVVVVHPDIYTQAPFLLSLINNVPTLYFAEEWYRLIYEGSLSSHRDGSLSALVLEWLHRRILKAIDRINVSQATCVITTSQFNKVNLSKAYGVNAEVIPLGVDTTFFKPDETDEKRIHFLFIGEKDEAHGYQLLAEVIHSSKLPFNVKVVSYNKKGFSLSEKELLRAYQRSAAVICLDINEPFGLIPLEAMSCGTTVIAVNEGGYAETVVQGETGLLIERTSTALKEAMRRIATDPSLRRAMEIKGRKHVEENYSWPAHIHALEKAFNDCVKKN